VQCPQCQHENRAQAKFCEGCGTRLVLKCAECGTELGPSARFCSECGAPVTAPTATAPSSASQPTSRFTSPQTYTPRHLAERIISSRGAFEGERKQVTVLFADIKGSMELLADRDPEEARRLLDPVLERMMEAVHRYDGTVNQVMGDGIMALFGAPLAHEDHAVRACYAALRLQEAVKQYAEQIQRTQGLPIHIRVGLNSGEVVVRSIGSDLRMDYTAVGQTTHLAARMEQVAMPGSVLVAPDTLQLAEGYVQVKALGPMAVKGLSEPVEVYELTGAGTARSRLQAAAARGLTKFVGRDAELETLRRTLEQAGSGHGQIVALVGEPGVGKSRLVWEFSHSHRTQGWLVLESGSVSYGKATSYLPVINLLKSYCGIEDRDDARRMREKVTGKLLTLEPELQPMLPAFLSLLDVPIDDPNWNGLDPPQRRQRTLDALKRLILRESQEQPLLLVFEDLHWIDAETQALLDTLVESLPTARLVVLVNYRPEYEHAWHRKTYYRELRLDPLPPESAEVLLTALLGPDLSLDLLRPLLIARTEGNPFFLEESVRALFEQGALVGERGAYRLAHPLATIQVPTTVQTVLAARIDCLAPEDKRLLQAAAVIGKDVPYALLAAIAELPEDALRQGLTRLQAAEFLYETMLFPEQEYTFKHALTHEVAYGSLLQARRRALHASIVAAIERLYPGRLMEQAERLAHHAVRGEQWEQAVAYLHQAGAKADARSAHRDATAYFEQALDALTHLPDTRTTREQAVDLRLDLRTSLIPQGEYGRILVHLREAQPIVEALADQRRLGRLAVSESHQYWWTADFDRSVDAGQRALAIGQALEDPALQVEASYYLALAYHQQGRYRRSIDVLTTIIHATADDRIRERFGLPNFPAALARSYTARCLAELGEFSQAIGWAEEALRIAEAVDHAFTTVVACRAAGLVYLRAGSIARAISLCERAVELCRRWQIRTIFVVNAASAANAYVLAGRAGDALVLLEEAAAQESGTGMLVEQSGRIAMWSETYLLAGRIAVASEYGQRALQLSRERKERGQEAWALHVLGEIAAHGGAPDVEPAEVYYHQAIALGAELGMRPLVAHCHLGLGTLHQKMGRGEQAQVELTTAAELYRAMEMSFWLEKAERAVAQVAS
jgi:class 3 adenylate cyclase/tetratricopeptide (TPR) repeat protein